MLSTGAQGNPYALRLEGLQVRHSNGRERSAGAHLCRRVQAQGGERCPAEQTGEAQRAAEGPHLRAIEPAAGSTVRQRITMQQGIPIEKAREIVKLIKNSKKKCKPRSKATWFASAARTAIHCRTSSRFSSRAISASTCSSPTTDPTDGRTRLNTVTAMPRKFLTCCTTTSPPSSASSGATRFPGAGHHRDREYLRAGGGKRCGPPCCYFPAS